MKELSNEELDKLEEILDKLYDLFGENYTIDFYKNDFEHYIIDIYK